MLNGALKISQTKEKKKENGEERNGVKGADVGKLKKKQHSECTTILHDRSGY